MIKVIHQILPSHYTQIAVAVSMGIDSVAAFLYLKSKGYNVFPLHYNHNLRPQNHKMQHAFRELMNEFSGRSNLDISNYFATNTPLGGYKSSQTESECRKNRIDFFKEECGKRNIKFLVTAHHLDDYVESYLLNCFRGKPDHKPIQLVSNFVDYNVLHPFLLTEKTDLQKFMDRHENKKYKKHIVVDETNFVIKGSRRNWIRNVILPELAIQKIGLKKFCREQINSQLAERDSE